MKISLEWLSQFLPGASNAEAFAHALTHGGFPVEVIEKHGDDTVIDVEVTSNRGDCLSHVGVARELCALLDRPFVPLKIEAHQVAPDASTLAQVRIDDLEMSPYYSARVVRGIRVGPSPAWMVRRLEAAGVRSINNVVDCTNYVMLELGQPLHAFDHDRLGDTIVIRRAQNGETLVTLDGHNRKLDEQMLVIADATKPVALAGVMGGLETEVSATSTNVLIESARFAPLTVRRMARALTMRSEASYRFERGIDPALSPVASLRCCQLLAEVAGGQVLHGIVEAGSASPTPVTLSLRLSSLRRVLGIEIAPHDAVAALNRLQLQPSLNGDRIDCTIPPHRQDLRIEVDLVEEVARVLGYDRIPLEERISIEIVPPQSELVAEEKIRSTLVSGGFFEAVTFSFATDGLAELFAPAGVKLCAADPGTRKSDAKLRPSILPGLLEAIRRNESVGVESARLFEIGSTYWHAPDGSIDERKRVALAAAVDDLRDGYRDVRGVVEALLSMLDASKPLSIRPVRSDVVGLSATGSIEWAGKRIGTIGTLSKDTSERLSLRAGVIAVELELAPLIEGTQHVPQLTPLPKFPAVRRDLSLVLPEATAFESVRSVVAGESLRNLEALEYVTTYRGKPLEKGTKSVTIALVFRSAGGTLTSEEVDASVAGVVNAAKEKLGATLRT